MNFLKLLLLANGAHAAKPITPTTIAEAPRRGGPKVKQAFRRFEAMKDDELMPVIDRKNRRSPFYGVVGQDQVVDQLSAVLITALKSELHTLPGGNALMFTGPASVGKTMLAKRLADKNGLNLPLVETDAKNVKGTDSLFLLIQAKMREAKIPLVPLGQSAGRTKYTVPACIIFIDELHGLSPVVMDALLKALESNDSTMILEDKVLDCQHVLWIGATTERGEIMSKNAAFDSRWEKIEFVAYSLAEVAEILSLNFKWPKEAYNACAVRGGGIVRECLAIGRKVERQLQMLRLRNKDATVMQAIDDVGKQMGIDEFGMSNMQLAVLESLCRSKKGMAYAAAARVIHRTVEELKQVVLPPLMLHSVDTKPKVVQTGRLKITYEGAAELHKRGMITEEQLAAVAAAA